MDNFIEGSWLHSIGMAHHQATLAAAMKAAKENQINIAMFVFFIVLAVRQFISRTAAAKKAGANQQYLEAPGFPEIEPLEKSSWQEQEPLKLRFFKPKYFLTMGRFCLPAYASCSPRHADGLSLIKTLMNQPSKISIPQN